MHDRNPPRALLICLVLAVITTAVYVQTLSYDFVNYDDTDYVSANKQVQSGLTKESVAWAFTTDHAGNWHPLTWLSHELDCQLYGVKPGAMHFTNLLFHVANAVLLFVVLLRMTGATWRSAVVAGLFAWHPTHVESVAWISERKDGLSTFFWLLTMLAYAGYAREFKVRGSKFKVHYALGLVFFACGLMSKPMLVTLPFVLLFLDYWPLGRIAESKQSNANARQKVTLSKAMLEKIPFLILAAASSVVTFVVQQKGGAVATLNALPPGARFANAVISYPRYVGKLLWPGNLSVLYPMPPSWPAALIAGALLFMAGVSVLAVWQMKRRPYVFVGWFWFLGTMVPVIGLVQVGVQSIADRYLYVPSIGLFIAAAWGVPDLLKSLPSLNKLLAPATAVVLALCAGLSYTQARYWQNSITLFTHAIEVTANNITAEYNLAKELERLGKTGEAMAHYKNALTMKSGPLKSLAETHYNLGTIFARQGQLTDAKGQFLAALDEKPDYGQAHINLAGVLWNLGELGGAAEHNKLGLRSLPGNDLALRNLALIDVELAKYPEAVTNFNQLLRRYPDEPELHTWLGYALANSGNPAEGIAHFKLTTQIKPDYVDGYLFWGDVLAAQGKTNEAQALFATALKFQPNLSAILAQSASAMNAQGRTNVAVMFGRLALELNALPPPH